VEHRVGSGRVRGWVGLASNVHRSTVPAARERKPPSTLRVARTLAVYAVFAPPLVLWSRTPSLRWFLPDTLIQLRRFEHVGRTGRRR
jgi:hypothetical protein